MELKNVKLEHLKNLTFLNCNGKDLSVAVVDRGVGFSEQNNIYVSFSTDEVEKCGEDEALTVKSFAVLGYEEEYPIGTRIGDLEDVEPIKTSRYETVLSFSGIVTDIQEVPCGTIDKYTKDLKTGYLITIKTEDWSFVLNLANEDDILECFSKITGKEINKPTLYVPTVGERIKGVAKVIGVLFQ